MTVILAGVVSPAGQPVVTVTLTLVPTVPEDGEVSVPCLTAAWAAGISREHATTRTRGSAAVRNKPASLRRKFPAHAVPP